VNWNPSLLPTAERLKTLRPTVPDPPLLVGTVDAGNTVDASPLPANVRRVSRSPETLLATSASTIVLPSEAGQQILLLRTLVVRNRARHPSLMGSGSPTTWQSNAVDARMLPSIMGTSESEKQEAVRSCLHSHRPITGKCCVLASSHTR
jgi:hypothetical protein